MVGFLASLSKYYLKSLMLRPEFSELKKIKVDFGFGLCIDGKSLSRHKQRFYILASALIEHFLEGIGKNHSLIFFQLIHLLSSKICLLAKWRPLCEITYTSGCWWSSQTWLLYIYLSLVLSCVLITYRANIECFFPYKRLLIVKNYRNPILWQLLKYIR